MIEVKNLVKRFGKKVALDNVTFNIAESGIFGLVGSNGAGKSTFLRTLAGVYKPDEGKILVDGKEPFENCEVKGNMIFISDYPYFFPQASIEKMAAFYKTIYPNWSDEKYNYYSSVFPLDKKMKITSMSKGMQRQAALILALSASPKYFLFDEIFDGLDPVVREVLRKLLIDFVVDNDATIIISSHNLHELEDFCDHVGLLHNGTVIMERELDSLKLEINKIVAVFENEADEKEAKSKFNIVKESKRGRLAEWTVHAEKEAIEKIMSGYKIVYYEVLPLSLEEVFISEMGAIGYDIKNVIE